MTEKKVTPMMEQYLEAKAKNPDALLFFRLGDFYELFFDDAKTVSSELNLTLTSRSGDLDKSPMCGVPYHAADNYIEKLILKGYKVAIAEQIGDPKAKGLTKREVVRVVTPGTSMFDNSLTEAKNNYIALLMEEDYSIALAAADLSTGECFYGVYTEADELFDMLYALEAKEILIAKNFSFSDKLSDFIRLRAPNTAITEIGGTSDFNLIDSIAETEIPTSDLAKNAVAALLDYIKNTAGNLNSITHIRSVEGGNFLILGETPLRNLEITKNLRDGGKDGTLYDVLDFTKTPMGSRLLKHYLERPLRSVDKIEKRLDAVEEFFNNYTMREDFFAAAKEVRDIERLLTRVAFGSAKAREVLLIKNSLFALPKIKAALSGAKSSVLTDAVSKIADFSELANKIETTIEDDAANNMRGRVVKSGVSEELDAYRVISTDSKALLQKMEEDEKEKTGIRALKIGYNRVFGYYIEVRNSGKDLIPENYERKQTLANAERYVTPELKEFETKILGAEGKAKELEDAIFGELLTEIAAHLEELQKTAAGLSEIDVFAGLAEAADKYNYTRPSLNVSGDIVIKDGRHPLVERLLKSEIFVPNDTVLNHRDRELLLITGPNMAGKSTYMRQVALIVIMAQMGAFVPAAKASISPVDRVFTRIGASDDLASGESTFMVEMKEVSHIVKNATADSLVILDEIGRGTSTYDGMSIARAVAKFISTKIHAKTLFATHYHELTDMVNTNGDNIKNLCVAVKERGGEVEFLRRIVEGAADKSYGIHVGKLAGLPEEIIKNAKNILRDLESGDRKAVVSNAKPKEDEETIGTLFTSGVLEDLLKIDCLSITPLEAMNTLFKLQERAKKEMGR